MLIFYDICTFDLVGNLFVFECGYTKAYTKIFILDFTFYGNLYLLGCYHAAQTGGRNNVIFSCCHLKVIIILVREDDDSLHSRNAQRYEISAQVTARQPNIHEI